MFFETFTWSIPIHIHLHHIHGFKKNKQLHHTAHMLLFIVLTENIKKRSLVSLKLVKNYFSIFPNKLLTPMVVSAVTINIYVDTPLNWTNVMRPINSEESTCVQYRSNISYLTIKFFHFMFTSMPANNPVFSFCPWWSYSC